MLCVWPKGVISYPLDIYYIGLHSCSAYKGQAQTHWGLFSEVNGTIRTGYYFGCPPLAPFLGMGQVASHMTIELSEDD